MLCKAPTAKRGLSRLQGGCRPTRVGARGRGGQCQAPSRHRLLTQLQHYFEPFRTHISAKFLNKPRFFHGIYQTAFRPVIIWGWRESGCQPLNAGYLAWQAESKNKSASDINIG